MNATDSHVHASLSWCEPVESLLYHMDVAGVSSAILIQLLNAAENNNYLLDAARRYPGRFATVVYVPPGPDALAELRELKQAGASGVRVPSAAVFDGKETVSLWHAAGELGLSVSCCGPITDHVAPHLADMLAEVSNIPVAIEHMGGRPLDPADSIELRQTVYALSRFTNLHLKVSGLGNFIHRTSPLRIADPYDGAVPPYYAMALDAFGPDRLMWGSDYPPVSGRDGYQRALSSARDQFHALPESELGLVFGGVARRVFPIHG